MPLLAPMTELTVNESLEVSVRTTKSRRLSVVWMKPSLMEPSLPPPVLRMPPLASVSVCPEFMVSPTPLPDNFRVLIVVSFRAAPGVAVSKVCVLAVMVSAASKPVSVP